VNRPEDPPTHRDHDDIGCLAAIEMFYAYLDGELDDPGSIVDFEHHMAHCRSCFTRAEFEGLLNQRLKGLASHRAPDRLKGRLRDLMSRF
jgi:anti-sigma factor (TIGR02949 family)